MPKAARHRPTLAVTASAVAHLVVLAIAFAQHPTIPIPDRPEVPAPDEITVQLVRLAPAASRAPATLRLHQVARPLSQAGPPLAPLPAQPASRPGMETAPVPAAPAGPDLRLGLRRGVAGCANAAATGMTRAERDLCNERLGRNVAKEPFLPAPIEGRIRAYYDAVILAKAPDPQPVHPDHEDPTFGEPDSRGSNGHPPGVGCKIHFGVGKKPPNAPPHALRLGPCFIEPPKGPLDPEVDITPP